MCIRDRHKDLDVHFPCCARRPIKDLHILSVPAGKEAFGRNGKGIIHFPDDDIGPCRHGRKELVVHIVNIDIASIVIDIVSCRRTSADEGNDSLKRFIRIGINGKLKMCIRDRAKANYDYAKADYEQAVSNTNDTIITSPIDGYVIGKPTPVGQTVSPGVSTPQVIMNVATLDKMQIELMVDESDIGQIKDGQTVESVSYTHLDVYKRQADSCPWRGAP